MGRLRAAAIAALVLVSCSGRERPPEVPRAVASDVGVPEAGGTLVRRLESDISSLNPLLATSRYDRFVSNYLFTPLVYLDRALRPIPGLARSWTVSKDGRSYRFELDERARFSDGRRVTAADVLFTIRKIIDPASEAVQIAGSFEQLDLRRTRVIDARTIEIAFHQPLAAQMIRFNDVLVLPEHVYGRGHFRNDFNDTAVGSGPYQLSKRQPGREIILERRRDYWGEAPHIDTVVFRVITDNTTAWNALRRGEIDESFLPSDTWLRERDNKQHTGSIEFLNFYTLNYNYIAWNGHDPLLRDPAVRRALARCIPADTIVRELYKGTARAMNGPFVRDDFAYNPSVAAIEHDPATAKRELTAMGWREADDGILERRGRRFSVQLITMAGSTTGRQFAQLLQQELRKAGVELAIRAEDPAAAIQRILAGNYQAAYLGWDLDPDPDPFAIFHSSQFPPRGQNFVFYRNTDADRLIDAARRELDRDKRRALYWKLHEILVRDQPYSWTIQGSSKWGISRRVRGVSISPGYGLYLWYPGEFSWWIPRSMRRHDAVTR